VQSSQPARASRVRVLITLIATVLVVAGEFVLLTTIYQRGDPVHRQRLVVSVISGEWRSTVAGSSPASSADPAATNVTSRLELAALDDTDVALSRLHSLGTSSRELGPLQEATTELRSDPADSAALTRVQATVSSLDQRLADETRNIDTQAEIIYAVLLVTVSVGWMLWFRRLVGRHRGLQRDLTSTEARAASEKRLAALVRNAADVVLVSDTEGVVSFVTPSVLAVLGVEASAVLGREWTNLAIVEDREPLLRQLATVHPGGDSAVRAQMSHSDGRVLNISGTLTNLLEDPSVAGIVLTMRDVTAQVQLETELTYQAFHDSLTGLANRQLFADRLAHALDQRFDGEPADRAMVVLFCDLDEFKLVNDSLGHGAGDQVLVEVAKRASLVSRRGDTVARLGGDEFAILMEDTDLASANRLAIRLQEVLNEPMTVDGQVLTVKASIGLARATPGEFTSEDALRNADVAMYLAKDRGKSTIAVYEPKLHAAALDRLALRDDLQVAIRAGNLTLHYQPTVELGTGRLAGFEALVRWTHPTRGLLSPTEFIPLAEQTGLIHSLGTWVLETACAAAAGLADDVPPGARRPTIAVNVTAQQLSRPDFVSEVLSVLADTGLEAERLTLEITESVLMRDVNAVVGRLSDLRSHGIRIAIDDFGTGYSSLSYLRALPLDILKIDKAFVDRVTVDPHDAALTEAILAMSTAMDLATVAEGVEEPAQAAWLTSANCRYGQGYLWSRPVPLDEARELLRASFDRRWATDVVVGRR
jgi:diguanylate cyclase (GGDEF)-like protein/PAS domain S-box-containing protein